MNILLTSVGRRSYLVKYFQQALAGSGRVITTNTHRNAAAMHAADHAIVVKPSNDPAYIDQILEICRQYRIQILGSFHDLDGYVLAQHKHCFEELGVHALVPDARWAEICLDKSLTAKTLADVGFDVPWQTASLAEAVDAISSGKVELPVVVKARHGFGSLGLSRCDDIANLLTLYRNASNCVMSSGIEQFVNVDSDQCVLIQQYLRGPEHCVDVFNDLDGNFICHFATTVHQMRAGESDLATTLPSERFATFSEKFARLSQHTGLWGVDVIEANGRDFVIEINPRFTGDYPFNHLAGANVPASLVSLRRGEIPRAEWLTTEPGVTGFKDLVPSRFK